MDESLQKIMHVRPLQETVITYRSNTQTYRRIQKETCIKEMENLVNVEMDIMQTELKMPDAAKVPPISELQPSQIQQKLDEILIDFKNNTEALELL